MKTRQQAAEDTVSELKARYLHDEIQDIDDLGVQCFLAGCEYTDGEHREFYKLVREMLNYFESSSFMEKQVNVSDGNMVKFAATKYDVKKHLASFTEREQPKD